MATTQKTATTKTTAEHVAALAANKAKRDAEKATKPVAKVTAKAKAEAAPKAPAAPKQVAPNVAARAANLALVGKVLQSVPDTYNILTVSFDQVTFHLCPMKYQGRWVWSVPGHVKPSSPAAPSPLGQLTAHKAYTLAGGFFAFTRNLKAAQAEGIRTRIVGRGVGHAALAKRTKANVQAWEAFVAANAEAKPE
jgi:hypothetical protein